MDHGMQVRRLVAGRYELLDMLGSGGFGCVWRAYDQRLGVAVAIKEVWLPKGSHVARGEYLSRAEREARNTARLRNAPHIVPVYDVINEDGTLWMVMRLIEGQSLEQRLAAGPLSVQEAEHVARNLLQALRAAHAAGVVHRDLKPANVLLESTGAVWLTDFGIAVHYNDTTLTAAGTVVGSPDYLAPERVDGGDAGPASDLFSLGALLYRALEGATPFHRETASATMRAVLLTEPAPVWQAGQLTALIGALLRKNPAERPTATAALAMLSPLMSPSAPAAPVAAPLAEGTRVLSAVGTPGEASPLSAASLAPTVREPGLRHAVRDDARRHRRARSAPSRRKPRLTVVVTVAGVIVVLGAGGAFAVNRLDRPAPPNLALNKTVYASSDFNSSGWAKAQVTDGSTASSVNLANMGWASDTNPGPDATEYVEVDLGAEEAVDDVTLFPRNDTQLPGACFPLDFTIETSTDGVHFTAMPPAVSEQNYSFQGDAPQNFAFTNRTARFVRVTATKLTADSPDSYRFELKQIEIFDR
jgi:serine/threonine protein kinase